MSARSGRNKRCAAREQIAALESENAHLKSQCATLAARATRGEHAYNAALQHLLKSSGYYVHLLELLVKEAGRGAGVAFEKGARRATQEALARFDHQFPFSMSEDYMGKHMVFHVHIPQMNMSVAASPRAARLYQDGPARRGEFR